MPRFNGPVRLTIGSDVITFDREICEDVIRILYEGLEDMPDFASKYHEAAGMIKNSVRRSIGDQNEPKTVLPR